MGVMLHVHQLGNLYRTRLTHPPDIVAAKVYEHDMLCPFFLVSLQLCFQGSVFLVGGGAGSFSIVLAREYPGLTSRVMDLPPVLEIARDLIAESGVGDRIVTVPCDVTKDDFGSGYDAALVSGLLHRMEPEECRAILGKVFAGLDAGGLVVVNDLFGTPAQDKESLEFASEHLDVVEKELRAIAENVPEMLSFLTDALRMQTLCDHEEGVNSLPTLLRAKAVGVLQEERAVPMPSTFMLAVRQLGSTHGLLKPMETQNPDVK